MDRQFLTHAFPAPVVMDGLTYPSVDIALLAARTENEEVRTVLAEIKPEQSRRIGSLLTTSVPTPVYNTLVRDLLRQKFSDKGLARQLLAAHPDDVWGADGEIIKSVRDELAAQQWSLRRAVRSVKAGVGQYVSRLRKCRSRPVDVPPQAAVAQDDGTADVFLNNGGPSGGVVSKSFNLPGESCTGDFLRTFREQNGRTGGTVHFSGYSIGVWGELAIAMISKGLRPDEVPLSLERIRSFVKLNRTGCDYVAAVRQGDHVWLFQNGDKYYSWKILNLTCLGAILFSPRIETFLPAFTSASPYIHTLSGNQVCYLHRRLSWQFYPC